MQNAYSLGLVAALALLHAAARMRVAMINAVHLILAEGCPATLVRLSKRGYTCRIAGRKGLSGQKWQPHSPLPWHSSHGPTTSHPTDVQPTTASTQTRKPVEKHRKIN